MYRPQALNYDILIENGFEEIKNDAVEYITRVLCCFIGDRKIAKIDY